MTMIATRKPTLTSASGQKFTDISTTTVQRLRNLHRRMPRANITCLFSLLPKSTPGLTCIKSTIT